MELQERRYKIKKRREYKEELSKVKKSAAFATFMIGFGSITLIVAGCLVSIGVVNPVPIYSSLSTILFAGRDLITNVREQARLETELENLESGLGYSQENTDRNQEERVGRSRW